MQRSDVVIVGGGFAGLAAACELRENGFEVCVLEARHRVGGRVEGVVNGLGEAVDLGGQFFCDDMPSVLALARAHGKTIVTTPFDGEDRLEPADHGLGDVAAIHAGSMGLRRRMRATDPRDPAVAGLTLQAWTEKQDASPEARRMFLSMIEGLWCMPAETIPFWYVASSDRRITNKVSELQYFAGETLHSLAEDLALSLGDAIRIGEPVETIVHGHDGILVRTRAGAYRTDHVIIAVPPVMARGIAFEPALPPVVGAALDAWESGMVVKAFARYPSPFWRDAGLSGSIMWADTRGLYVCDASPDDRHATLVIFTGGEIATRWMAEGEAGYRSIVLARLVAALGPKAAEPLDFVCRNWSHDGWSGGGYSDTVMAMEALDAEDVLRAGLPGVTFACSELSPSYPGYVEGAITSGRLQARAVIESLARGRAPRL